LRNLKLVSEPEFERLRTMDSEGRSKRIASALGLETDESLSSAASFNGAFWLSGLEALRREKISQAKFLQLAETRRCESVDCTRPSRECGDRRR